MTDDELKALVAGLAVAQDRTDEQMKRTDEQIASLIADGKNLRDAQKMTNEQMKRTDERLARIGITLGTVTNNQGDVAEDFFFQSLI